MYNVVIVENDREQARMLEDMVRRHPRGAAFQISHVERVDELAQRASSGTTGGCPIDILFMDICLSDGEDGVEAVKRLFPEGCRTQVIYVSGYAEHCVRVYQSEHTYFLLKPVDSDDLFDAIDKALDNIAHWVSRPIGLSVGGDILRVDPSHIEYVESARRKIRVRIDGRDVEAYGSLSRMMEVLPDTFLQCHKSFIVNIPRIAELRSGELVMLSGARIPVSQKRRRAVKEELLGYLRTEL